MTTALDPTRICHNDMLLSECVSNHSVYYYGYANPVQSDCWSFNSPCAEAWGRLGALMFNARAALALDGASSNAFSISYGWIHPRLSERIVKWKDPTATSYHRWDEGAAVDVNFHHTTYGPYYYARDLDPTQDEDMGTWQGLSPLGIATLLNQGPSMLTALDRTITYSESPYVCLAVGPPVMDGRGKWYENRFMGTRSTKPQYIAHAYNRGGARTDPLPLTVDWRGGGYPSYHGGGKRQYHHIRTGLYSNIATWLYNRDKVHFGRPNRMPTSNTRYERVKQMMFYAARTYDVLQAYADSHLPVVDGIQIDRRTSNWESEGRWSFTIACPPSDQGDFYQRIQDHVMPANGEMLRITGVAPLVAKPYLAVDGSTVQCQQHRIRIEGEYDDVGNSNDRFDFDRAATSPEFREGTEERSNGGGTNPARVANANPRTRPRRTRSDSRRSLRTRTFDR